VSRDGRPDLIATLPDTDAAAVMLGNGTGSFGPATLLGAGDVPWSLVPANLDCRGGVDLVVANLNSNDVSILLNTTPAAPIAPTNVTALPGNGQATVSWSPPVITNGAAVTAYAVTPYVNGVAQAPVTFYSTATSRVVGGLTNGNTYTFRVRAYNGVGWSPLSAPSSGVVPA
jgi:hypothetical protein